MSRTKHGASLRQEPSMVPPYVKDLSNRTTVKGLNSNSVLGTMMEKWMELGQRQPNGNRSSLSKTFENPRTTKYLFIGIIKGEELIPSKDIGSREKQRKRGKNNNEKEEER